jgi:hypothetical protein
MRRLFLSALRKSATIALLMLTLLLLQSTLFAQQTGMITGTAFDATGAVVPGAKVTLMDQATKSTRQTTTNGEGFFTFAGVMPSTYTVRVEMKGFKTWSVTGLPMNPGDKRNISNIALTVGASGESITVEASVSQIQVVDSGEKSTTLSAEKIQKLGLQGRDVTEVIRTVPGFNYSTGSSTGSAIDSISNGQTYDPSVAGIGSAIGNGFNANGLGRGGIDLVADGAHVLDPGCNCNATQNVNGDMVAEVKVSTSNFGADNAKGPIVVNAVGKSGSSQYHGNLYLHARDGVLNSKNAFLQDFPKPQDRYLYPGAQIGGPVNIPGTKLKTKMFFWSGFEYYNQIYPDASGLLKAIVPTSDMRNGNFDPTTSANKPLCDALNYSHGGQGNWTGICQLPTGGINSFYRDANGVTQPILTAANILPGNAITNAGRAFMSMIPGPNRVPTLDDPYNYELQYINNRNGFSSHSRVDYNFSDNTKLYVSYNYQTDKTFTPTMLMWTPPESVVYPANMQQTPKSHTITGNFLHVFSPSLTNEFIGTLAYLGGPFSYGNEAAVSRSALGYPASWTGIYNNGTDLMPALSNSWWSHDTPMMYQADAHDFQSVSLIPTLADNVTKVWRTHTIKAGFYWESTGKKQSGINYTNGLYTFGQGPFCNNFVGSTVYNCINNDPNDANWKAKEIGTPNPYANLLEGVTGFYQESNINPVYDLAYKSFQFYATDSWKLTKRLTVDFGARFEHDGAWYDKNGTGLSVFTDQWYQEDMALPVAQRPAYPGARWNAIDSSIPITGRKVNAIFVSPRFGMAFDVFGTGKTIVRGGWGAYRYRDQYNDVAGALDPGLGVKTYTINGGYYLQDLSKLSANSAMLPTSISAINPYDHQQPLTNSYSFTFSQQMPASSVLEISYVGNQSKYQNTTGKLMNKNIIPLGAYFLPDPITHTNTDLGNPNENDFRPYQAYAAGAVNVYDHRNYSNYNGLQVEWKRDRGWLSYGVNYTWSKSMGIQGEADPLNLDANYGVTSLDRSHVIQANYSIDLGTHLHGTSGLFRGIVNGWTISGITNWQSGQNMQAAYNSNFSMSASVAGSINYGNAYILGTSDYNVQPVVTCDPTSNLASHQYINGNCFALPAVGTNGWMKFPYIHGPSFFNQDMTLHKTFKMTERQNLEFRMSAFNVFNHPVLGFDPNNTSTLDLAFKSLAGGLPSNYGVATYKNGRRVVELMIKYSF